jgi:hypothetical protein
MAVQKSQKSKSKKKLHQNNTLNYSNIVISKTNGYVIKYSRCKVKKYLNLTHLTTIKEVINNIQI